VEREGGRERRGRGGCPHHRRNTYEITQAAEALCHGVLPPGSTLVADETVHELQQGFGDGVDVGRGGYDATQKRDAVEGLRQLCGRVLPPTVDVSAGRVWQLGLVSRAAVSSDPWGGEGEGGTGETKGLQAS